MGARNISIYSVLHIMLCTTITPNILSNVKKFGRHIETTKRVSNPHTSKWIVQDW